MTSWFLTGADVSYGYQLLNLLGSLAANSPGVFDRVVAYDLGLTEHQRDLLDDVRDVEVREVPPFVEHWARGFTWKPWIWTHAAADGDHVFWLDAGCTVLRPLRPVLDGITLNGSFLVSQKVRLREIVPRDYYELYGLDASLGDTEYAAAGIIGFTVGGEFYRRVIVPTYEDCLAGRSLGFSPGEEGFNRGLNATDRPVVRDCRRFRWDQTVLNIRLFREYPAAQLEDLYEFGGFRSRRDHPRQVIWNHRRRGPLAYLARVPYAERHRVDGRIFGLRYRIRWWRKRNERWFTPTTYVLKLRKIASSFARSPA